MTMQAIWNGAVLAESDDTVLVEGNHYFPRDSLNEEYFTPSWLRTICPWKGIASYYTVTVDGQVSRDAAWEYKRPFPTARKVKRRVAFWGGVEVVEVDTRGDRTVAR
jgi:uncharacterized protein (DUF427 family)